MRTIPLLEIDGSFDDYRELFEVAASVGVRLGWLEWDPTRDEPAPEAPRRVVVTNRATRIEIARRGAPVLADVLRSSLLGCDAVLVAGELGAPRLLRTASGYRVEAPDQPPVDYTAVTLLDALRRPSVVLHRWQRKVKGE